MAFGSSTSSSRRPIPSGYSHSLVFFSNQSLSKAITKARTTKSARTCGACVTPCAGHRHKYESCSHGHDSPHQMSHTSPSWLCRQSQLLWPKGEEITVGKEREMYQRQMICFALPRGSVKNNMAHVALWGRRTTSAYNCFPGNVWKLDLSKILIDHKNVLVFYQAVSGKSSWSFSYMHVNPTPIRKNNH